jgi:hypothetical protein
MSMLLSRTADRSMVLSGSRAGRASRAGPAFDRNLAL